MVRGRKKNTETVATPWVKEEVVETVETVTVEDKVNIDIVEDVEEDVPTVITDIVDVEDETDTEDEMAAVLEEITEVENMPQSEIVGTGEDVMEEPEDVLTKVAADKEEEKKPSKRKSFESVFGYNWMGLNYDI